MHIIAGAVLLNMETGDYLVAKAKTVVIATALNYIEYAKAKGCSMTGPEDPDIERLNVLA